MTRSDAQLLFDWLVRVYGDPRELERPATATFANRSEHHHRKGNSDDNPKARRDKHGQQDQRARRFERAIEEAKRKGGR
jgi:hypothetical protein